MHDELSSGVLAERLAGIETLNAAQFEGIRAELSGIRKLLWSAGSLVVVTLISLVGWGFSQQLNATRADTAAQRAQLDSDRAQIQMIQSQMASFVSAIKATQVERQSPIPEEPLR